MRNTSYYTHGGDVYSAPVRLDFSSNLNPLGMPNAVRSALAHAEELAGAYPDPRCRKLKAALARVLGVSERHVLVTAGASDMIMRVCQAVRPQRALVTAPCFSGYERALEAVGAQVLRHELEEAEDFALTERILSCLDSSVGLALLCTPNNPTGLTIPLALLEQIAQRAQRCGTVLLVDERFLAFAGAPSARSLLERFENLVIVDAFTKIYSLAGLRLGFGLCPDECLLARIECSGPEWAVSALAQQAGCAALEDTGFIAQTRAFVTGARQQLASELRARGLRVIDGEANFLLFQSAVELFEPLLDQGILIRPCARYHGLDESWFRVAVKTPEDNAQLIRALDTVLQQDKEIRHDS